MFLLTFLTLLQILKNLKNISRSCWSTVLFPKHRWTWRGLITTEKGVLYHKLFQPVYSAKPTFGKMFQKDIKVKKKHWRNFEQNVDPILNITSLQERLLFPIGPMPGKTWNIGWRSKNLFSEITCSWFKSTLPAYLPAYLPWIVESGVTLDIGSDPSGPQVIYPRQFLFLIKPLDQFLRL